MHTPWGYEVSGALPALLDAEKFAEMTGNRHSGDIRVQHALDAASAAVRGRCGWHVSPSVECIARVTAQGRMAVLPARFVTAVSSVSDGGTALGGGEYEARSDGLLRRCCFKIWCPSWEAVKVTYTAGFEQSECADLLDVVAHLAEVALNSSSGVLSESAGGVSVSYDTSTQDIAAALEGRGIASILSSYRLVSAHAL